MEIDRIAIQHTDRVRILRLRRRDRAAFAGGAGGEERVSGT